MCGRYMVLTSPEAIRRLFGYPEQPNFRPRYNVAPTQPMAIVRVAEGRRQFALVRWGLIPPWVKDPRAFTLLINARVESVNDKPAFRYAMRRRRCLFPADGFYEWKDAGGGRKRPYAVRPKDGEPSPSPGCGKAGWGRTARRWRPPPSSPPPPTASSRPARPHAGGAAARGVRGVARLPQCRCRTATALCVPARDGLLEAYEVSPAVNRATTTGRS